MTPNPMQQIRELRDLLAFKQDVISEYNRGSQDQCHATADALTAILDNPDWVCVPREPTHEMRNAGSDRLQERLWDSYLAEVNDIYKAMMAAGEKA